MDGWNINGNNFFCLVLFGIDIVLFTFSYFFLSSNLTTEPAFKLIEPEILESFGSNDQGSGIDNESDISKAKEKRLAVVKDSKTNKESDSQKNYFEKNRKNKEVMEL